MSLSILWKQLAESRIHICDCCCEPLLIKNGGISVEQMNAFKKEIADDLERFKLRPIIRY